MIRSMTGFGRSRNVSETHDISVEIRAVNHRYNELTVKLPRQYGFMEDRLKKLVGSQVSRGKTEVYVRIKNTAGKEVAVEANIGVIEQYYSAIMNAAERMKEVEIIDDFSISTLFKIPEAFTVTEPETDEAESEVLWEEVKSVSEAALTAFVQMRESEGEHMKADILSRLEFIGRSTEQIDLTMPACVEKYRERLLAKMNEVLEKQTTDEQRVLLEAALFAEKTAVDEETVRLRSHVTQVRELFNASDEPVGRKLDFLVQEMNREVNTIGSKAHEISVTRLVVDMKSELEKIREQIQNIE